MKKMLKSMVPVTCALFALVVIGCHAKASVEVRSSASAKAKAGATAETTEATSPQPTAPSPVEPTPPKPVAPEIPKPPFEYTVAEGGSYAYAVCPNTAEELNGLDDDCDGQVDEDWVKSGPLQITLWWSGDPDLDLSVTDPSGKTVNVKKKKIKSGGEMDKDSRSACKGGETIENIYWIKDPPKGTYKVDVNYYSSCGHKADPPPVEANIAISHNGQFFGPFKKVMNSKEKATLIQFVLE